MLPDLIELPRPQDICKGDWCDEQGRCCAEGWLMEFFIPKDLPAYGDFRTAATIASRLVGRYIMGWNDDPRTTKKEIARVIEETVLEMGYELVE